ncbi:hypothetical protein [Diaphorobacter ruginosibacter]|uniref:hypothetical protein n=1 Tax=Diaphorobacter ruginosibacter TaxID=1715720 RepID=UPI0033407439
MALFLMAAAVLIGAPACAGPVAMPDAEQAVPRIEGRILAQGKGMPNGRSGRVGAPFTLLEGVSTDATYGYTQANAIKVGNGSTRSGPANQQAYLNALLAADGRVIEYERVGSCCYFESADGGTGGLLDVYSVALPDRGTPVLLYLNMYEAGVQLAPVGFTARRQAD